MLKFRSSLNQAWRGSIAIVIAFSVLSAIGCGSGGGSGTGRGGGTAPPPDFSLSATPSSVTVNAGSTATVNLSAQGTNGFSGSIAIAIAGLPSGVTASSVTLQSSQSAAVTLTASASASPVGNVTVTVTGTSGTLSHQATFAINVLGTQSFSLSVQPATINIIPGTIQTAAVTVNAVNGFTGEVAIAVSGLPSGVTISPPTSYGYPGSIQTITFSAASTASTSSTITFTGTSGSLSAQAQAALHVVTTPDFLLNTGAGTGVGINAGASAGVSINALGFNGFSSPISVTLSGLPSGVTVTPSSFVITPGSSQAVTFAASLTAPVTQTTITAQGTGGSITNQVQFQLYVIAPTLVLELSPTSLTIPAGSASGFNVEILADGYTNSPTGTVAVSLSGLPSGVTASTASYSTPAPGGNTQIYLSAASSGAKSGTVTVTATYGPETSTATLPVTIGPGSTNTVVPLKSRSKYVRADATSEYDGYPPPNYTVYHAPSGRFFASDFSTNHLNVFDSVSEKQIATIVVPGAFGMDQSPDNSILYVGTLSGDLYTVDPVNLVITKRYPSNTISAYGFPANAVYALANGKLLLAKYLLLPGYSFVDGNGPLALWDPADNSIVEFTGSAPLGTPVASSCFEGFEFGILTNSRTRFLITPVITAEGSSLLCSFDPNAGTWVYSPTITDGDGGSLLTLAVSPDGKTVAAYDDTKIYILDAATLTIKNSFAIDPSANFAGNPSIVIGPDNQTLYMQVSASELYGNQLVYAYNMTTGLQTGWLPEVQVFGDSAYATSVPFMQAMSANGLIGGVMEQGFGFLDTTALNPLPVGTAFGAATLIGTPYGPVAGGTEASWWVSQSSSLTAPPLGTVYFGMNAATAVSASKLQEETIFATSPAGAAGPADVVTVTTDGGEQILPEAFSYGPAILEAPTSYATAEGGGPGQGYGYGFGVAYSTSGPTITAPPADLRVTIGSASAALTGFVPDVYASGQFSYEPFPMVGAEFTIPAGNSGASAAITVSNGSGTVTTAQGITYLPAIQAFPLDSAQLIDGVYDSLRDVYYFSDATQVRIFSRTQGKWLTSIPIPGSVRLFGLALSPDRSKLVISDAGSLTLDVLDPDTPATIKSYALSSLIFGEAITETPAGVAITNAGQIYFATFDQDGDGAPYLVYFDPVAKTLTNIEFSLSPENGSIYLQSEGNLPYGRLPMSADGTRIYVNNSGQVGYVDTTTNTGIFATQTGDLGQDGFEVVLSADQTSVFADGFTMDSQLNINGFQALNWRESVDADYVFGATLSTDGSLLFQPGSQSIDIFDGRTGAFRARVSLSVQLSPNYRALVGDGKDNVQVAITGENGNGIAIIDFSSIPEPNPLVYPQQSSAVHANLRGASAIRKAPESTITNRRLRGPAIRLKHRTRKYDRLANSMQPR